MPRANRFYLPGYVWHITHRCHKKDFLLKFDKDKQRWIHWLFEAKKRYGLCVLNYMATSNHIHLLVYEKEEGTIPKSMQLIAGRVGQEYNIRKKRHGAYWEDRYHATIIDTKQYLAKCMIYIDFNMVRAGMAHHPSEWSFCGYNEIVNPRERYSIIDHEMLANLFQSESTQTFISDYKKLVETELSQKQFKYEPNWSNSIAIGSEEFVRHIQQKLGIKVYKRNLSNNDNDTHWVLHDSKVSYT